MDHEQDFDDGLVHNHGWATEPATAAGMHRRPGPPDTSLIPTPSTAYRDDEAEG
jgi:hypothetical protein